MEPFDQEAGLELVVYFDFSLWERNLYLFGLNLAYRAEHYAILL